MDSRRSVLAAVFVAVACGAGIVSAQGVDLGQRYRATLDLNGQSQSEVFDRVWEAFDREYAMFAIKPKVDWAKLRETYRPRAAAAETNHELAAVISEMLDHLEDLHVYVTVDGETIAGYNRHRPLNANRNALPGLVGPITSTGHDLDWGRTADGIGYVNIFRLSDPALPEAFDDVLGRMADTRGLILDLRYNGGGSEPLGCQIAGRFLDRSRVYSLSQYRNGPKHTDLGPKHERTCGPVGPWHYAGPVVVLQGRKTMSSAESFALALAQCPRVTTLGERTAGSSGNPRRVDAGAGIVVNLPRWIDMDPAGKPIDAVGVAPRVKIEAKPEDFRGDRDPALSAALENLRSRPKSEASPPGGVLQAR
ncbi:MAG: S41 family peptidase [Planctomycetia bacterium]|nr:S41 family peptidase [Planctomycetia bacterium]